MPRKKATTKKVVEKVEIPKGVPPKPLEKLTKGQVLYALNPIKGWEKRVYEKDYKGEGEILCRDENGQGWILNIDHLHKTILLENEYLGLMDKGGGGTPPILH